MERSIALDPSFGLILLGKNGQNSEFCALKIQIESRFFIFFLHTVRLT